MTDKKVTFYRVEHEGTLWQPGQMLQFGADTNEFTTNWRSEETRLENPRTRTKEFVNLEMIKIYESLDTLEIKIRPLGELVALPVVLLKTLQGLDAALLANREFAFEFVRRERFPDKPSRMSCMFLIPDSVEGVKFWWNELQSQGKSKRKLFRVAASGIIHRVNQDLLVPLRTCSILEWESKANEYWCDQASESSKDEVLFAGDLEVISEVNIGEFGLKHD